ncbi:MAG: type VI secretion system protein ImpE [Planctomycetota bacterium]|jgi:type VI secretion system protein ImpE
METLDLFNSGHLGDAIASATADVKSKPSDIDLRSVLADLLCFSAEYERADKHLDAITKLEPSAATVASLTRQLVRAETWRQDFYREGRTPEFLTKPSENVKLQLRASIAMREGATEEAAGLLGEVEEARVPLACTSDDQSFEDLRDCDDLVGGVFEVFTSTGKYYWVPMDTVREIEPRPIERPRDLLWRRVRLEVADGPEGEVYLPTLYSPMPEGASEAMRLGRLTEFTESDPVRGLGRRQFLLGDDAVSVDDLPYLRFPVASEG